MSNEVYLIASLLAIFFGILFFPGTQQFRRHGRDVVIKPISPFRIVVGTLLIAGGTWTFLYYLSGILDFITFGVINVATALVFVWGASTLIRSESGIAKILGYVVIAVLIVYLWIVIDRLPEDNWFAMMLDAAKTGLQSWWGDFTATF